MKSLKKYCFYNRFVTVAKILSLERRKTLARSAFHGFSIGFQRCKTAQILLSLKNAAKAYLVIIDLLKSASIQPRTSPPKICKNPKIYKD